MNHQDAGAHTARGAPSDVMIDIETLSTKKNALIVAIGACTFFPHTTDIEDSFYMTVDLSVAGDDLVMLESHIDPATVSWWMQQNPNVVARTFNVKEDQGKSLSHVMNALINWLAGRVHIGSTRFWANDPDFDCTILQHALDKSRLDMPWKFGNFRSVRTMKQLGHALGVPLPLRTSEHYALADCFYQTAVVQGVYREQMRLKRFEIETKKANQQGLSELREHKPRADTHSADENV